MILAEEITFSGEVSVRIHSVDAKSCFVYNWRKYNLTGRFIVLNVSHIAKNRLFYITLTFFGHYESLNPIQDAIVSEKEALCDENDLNYRQLHDSKKIKKKASSKNSLIRLTRFTNTTDQKQDMLHVIK